MVAGLGAKMRGTTRAAAAALVTAAVLAAGCGTLHSSGAAGGSTNSAACVVAKVRSGELTLNGTDNGKTMCVPKGTVIYVFLRGSHTHMWSAIKSSSAVLQVHPSGMMTLMVGVTGGSYQAVHIGTAQLTSSRRPCAPAAACTSQAFWVRLYVRAA